MPGSPRLELHAPARLTLGLAVTARRGDGFHELHTIFAKLQLADVLTVRPANGFSLETESAPGLPGGDDGEAARELILRAAALFAGHADCPGAHFHLVRNVPAAAGLAGAASGAAAALLLLARLCPAGGEGLDLNVLAAELGSDVPFFLNEARAALGRGRGEKLSALELPERHVVLVHPGGAVAGWDAYAWLQNFSRRLPVERIVSALATDGEPRLQNALQSGVVLKLPVVRDAIMALRDLGLRGVLMSGSGPACFGLAGSSEEAEAAATQLHDLHPDWWVHTDRIGGSG